MTSSGQASDAASAKITRSSGEKSSPVICAGKTNDPFFGSGVALAPESQRNYHYPINYPSCLILLLNRLVILINHPISPNKWRNNLDASENLIYFT